jgi:hypothetical protein
MQAKSAAAMPEKSIPAAIPVQASPPSVTMPPNPPPKAPHVPKPKIVHLPTDEHVWAARERYDARRAGLDVWTEWRIRHSEEAAEYEAFARELEQADIPETVAEIETTAQPGRLAIDPFDSMRRAAAYVAELEECDPLADESMHPLVRQLAETTGVGPLLVSLAAEDDLFDPVDARRSRLREVFAAINGELAKRSITAVEAKPAARDTTAEAMDRALTDGRLRIPERIGEAVAAFRSTQRGMNKPLQERERIAAALERQAVELDAREADARAQDASQDVRDAFLEATAACGQNLKEYRRLEAELEELQSGLDARRQEFFALCEEGRAAGQDARSVLAAADLLRLPTADTTRERAEQFARRMGGAVEKHMGEMTSPFDLPPGSPAVEALARTLQARQALAGSLARPPAPSHFKQSLPREEQLKRLVIFSCAVVTRWNTEKKRGMKTILEAVMCPTGLMREDEIPLAKNLTVKDENMRGTCFVHTRQGKSHLYSLTEAGMNLARSYKSDLINPAATENALIKALEKRDENYYGPQRK